MLIVALCTLVCVLLAFSPTDVPKFNQPADLIEANRLIQELQRNLQQSKAQTQKLIFTFPFS